jgi:predicted DCC family thiol-disulfide oxidoreductase YuxK
MQPVLIFDGECGFCTRTANAVMRLNTKHRFGVLPWQTPGLLDQTGLTQQECMDAAWFVDEHGHKYRGAAAINATLSALGGVFAVAAWLYRIPGLKQIEDAVYRWVADHRYRLPGASDACKIPTTGDDLKRQAHN